MVWTSRYAPVEVGGTTFHELVAGDCGAARLTASPSSTGSAAAS